MKANYECLHRLVRQLSSEYDIDSPYEAPNLIGFPSLPLHMGPDWCSFPCLSLSMPSKDERDAYDPNNIDENQRELNIGRLSRKVKYGQHAIPRASHTMLRNVILTFGSLLETQIQRRIYNIMKSKSKSLHPSDKEIVKKFTDLPTSRNGSLVIPELVWTNFSTILPMERFHEMGYDKVSFRFMFHCEITVRIVPNNSEHTLNLKAPGLATAKFLHYTNRPDALEIDIDTKILYNAIRKECKVISNKVVNAIVGFELVKTRRNKTGSSSTRIRSHGVGFEKSARSYATSDGGTFKTEKSSLDDQDSRSLQLHQENDQHHNSTRVEKNIQGHASEDITPNKKARSLRFNYLRRGVQHNALKKLESHNTIVHVGDEVDTNTPISHEESREEFREKDKKTQDSSWKRLISSSPKNSHKMNKNESREDKETESTKSHKNADNRWKGMFANPKQ